MAKSMSKSELIQKIVDQHPNGITRKDVKGVKLLWRRVRSAWFRGGSSARNERRDREP
jgi:nucleoid DNA-binding protein